MASIEEIKPGTILHGPMPGVDHDKFYVICGVSENVLFVCSVIINSEIHPFIRKRPHLLKRQIPISNVDYPFLAYPSYINCAQPLKINASQFLIQDYTVKDYLKEDDLKNIINNVIATGELSAYDINYFFSK